MGSIKISDRKLVVDVVLAATCRCHKVEDDEEKRCNVDWGQTPPNYAAAADARSLFAAESA